MQVSEVISLVREKLADIEPDYLWSDDVLGEALAHAQQTLCLRTHCLTGRKDITFAAGEATTPLPDDILVPRFMRYDGKDFTVLPGWAPPDDGTSTSPRCFYHDNNELQVYPTQTDSFTGVLSCYLLPGSSPVSSQAFAVPDKYHHALIAGAVFFALQTLDADVENDKRLNTANGIWEEELFQARTIAVMHGHKRKPIAYGGL